MNLFYADLYRRIPAAVDAERENALAERNARAERSALRSEAIEERVEAALYRCTGSELAERIAAHDLWTMVDDILHAVLQEYRQTTMIVPTTPARLQAMHKLFEALVREEVAAADREEDQSCA